MTCASIVAMQGGCFCGFVRYQADGAPFDETNCHCSICRRTSGAPFVAWFSVARANFRWLAGQPTTLRSSDHGTRTFCPRCGTPLSFASSHFPDQVDVTICSLPDPDQVRPRDHIHTGGAPSWVRLCDDLPRFVQARPASKT
jgi:hypothetical protein